MSFISSLIGLASDMRRAAEQRRLRLRAMKLQVTASSSPRAAAARRTRRSISLRAGRGRPGDALGARQRRRGDLVVAVDPGDFLDQVGRCRRCRAASSARDASSRRRTRSRARSRIARCSVVGHVDRRRARASRSGSKRTRLRLDRRRAGADHAARLAAANVEDQPGQDRQARRRGRPDRPRARSGCARRWSGQRLAGPGDPLGREIGDLEQHVGGRLG